MALSPAIQLAFSAALLVLLTGWSPSGHTEPTKRALLIGIDKYRSPEMSALDGAANDVELMQAALIGKFGFPSDNVKVLRDEHATRQAILDGIRSLIEAKPPADVAVIHFSGHGSQMEDRSGDELDQLDETIVPHDSRTDGVFDISDDEINGLLTQLSAVTPNVTLTMDSCHSGSVARAGEVGARVRQAPRDERPAPEPASFALGERGNLEGRSDFRAPDARYVLLSGAQANELANEGLIGDRRYGAFSYYLAQALRGARESTTFRDIMPGVGSNVTARFPSQHPDQEGTGLDTTLFGDRQVLPRPFVLVEPEGPNTVTVKAGTVLGIAKDAVLSVYPPGTKRFDGSTPPTTRVRIVDVRDFEAAAKIEDGGAVAPHSRAALTTIRPPDFFTGVYFHNPGGSPALQAIRAALADHESLSVVTAVEDAEIRVRLENGKLRLEGHDLQVLSEIPEGRPGLIEQAVDRISHWGRWYSILAIDNPNPSVDVSLRIHRSGTPATEPQPDVVTSGSSVDITVVNRSDVSVYLTILDLASDGSVCVLHPGRNCQAIDQSDALSPGNSFSLKRIPAWVPDGRQASTDVVKVIATTTKISPYVFQLGPTPRGSARAGPAGESMLERFVRLHNQGLTRNLGSITVDGWVARTSPLKVVRPAAAQPTFALHFPSDDAAKRSVTNLGGSRAICGPVAQAGCYEVKPVQGDPTIVEVRTPAARGGEALTSVGGAFDEAYRLQAATGATRAEPMFEMRIPRASSAPHPDSPQARGTGQETHDDRAKADAYWSLRHTRTPEAWAKLRTSRSKAAGSEASGVVIAHPDTGYREHEELWSPDADSPIWPAMGYDYYGEDNDATDDLLDTAALDNPAHGTGSGSAIVSPDGCQLPGSTLCPTGPALGARLVPLRVNRSVVHFDTRRLTQAILDASGNDRKRVKAATDVMSISMGGVPSWSLWKAVTKAEERGYLIVAAAGNYVKVVVWPARFDAVVAVAATNAGCRPWAWTSVGSTVDFSAPGESVWRGTLEQDRGSGTWNKIISMGTGTTYATATTAGIAALWIAKHKGTAEFERLKQQGRIAETFRALVQQTAWQPGRGQPASADCDPGTRWSPQLMGAGIIDAAALLDAPLAAATARAPMAPDSIEELPLWSSLYDPATPSTIIQSDYRRLFDFDAAPALQKVALFEAEVLFHYAMEEKVAAAFDAVTSRGNRSPAGFAAAREALRAQDLSSALRAQLSK